MFSKVRVRRGALNHFRRTARKAFPLEVQAYLIGRVVSLSEIEIEKFVYTKNYAKQTTGEVSWFQCELDDVKSKAVDMGLSVIGDIHSHPSWDAVMSPADLLATIAQSAHISGIVSIYNNRTRVRFWTPASALPCKITYV